MGQYHQDLVLRLECLARTEIFVAVVTIVDGSGPVTIAKRVGCQEFMSATRRVS
jgi:hypothetical protein